MEVWLNTLRGLVSYCALESLQSMREPVYALSPSISYSASASISHSFSPFSLAVSPSLSAEKFFIIQIMFAWEAE